jgi:hypothetical protein
VTEGEIKTRSCGFSSPVWKFYPCHGMLDIIIRDVQEKGSFVLSDYDKCPSCRCELKCKEYVVSDRRKEST